ncbi:MAG: hypothetical protein ACREOQ_13455, partial [Gemmatimonadales bacterium]
MRIYLLVGEPEKALDQLEPLLKILLCLARLASDRSHLRPPAKQYAFQTAGGGNDVAPAQPRRRVSAPAGAAPAGAA